METRIPPPFIVLITAILMFVAARFTAVLPVTIWPFALLFGLGGLALVVSGFRTFREARTTIDPRKPAEASTVVASGIFRHTRNPMYLGMTLVLFALAIYLRAPWTLLGPIAFVAYITRFQIRPEERALTEKFGDEYMRYTKITRRWF